MVLEQVNAIASELFVSRVLEQQEGDRSLAVHSVLVAAISLFRWSWSK